MVSAFRERREGGGEGSHEYSFVPFFCQLAICSLSSRSVSCVLHTNAGAYYLRAS